METRLKSNVRRRGKDQPHPKIIDYVEKKCFEMFLSDKKQMKQKIGMTAELDRWKGKGHQNELLHELHIHSYVSVTVT